MQLVSGKNLSIEQFEAHIDAEKENIVRIFKTNKIYQQYSVLKNKNQQSHLSNELQNQYQEKCNEMVTELENVFESQKSIFKSFYDRFEQEIQIDNEQEANIPKFSEIREKVSQLDDIEKVEQYLTQLVHQKEGWNAASNEVRTLGQRTEEYYREQIEKMQQQLPTFASKEKILEIWTQGLNDLIQKVKNQSGCFNNMFEQTQGIVLNISKFEEISLITNEMIKDDTELVLNFGKKVLYASELQKLSSDLSTLTNLKHLTINLDNSQITTESVQELSKAISILTGLRYLNLNIYGNKLGDEFTSSFGSAISNLTQLENLHFELGMNGLTSNSIENLVKNLGSLTHLKNFTFDAKYNKITDASPLATALNNFSSTLTHLNISFGGYSVSKNSLTVDSSKQLVRAIKQLTNLTNLSLDLGFTGFDNSCAFELSQSLIDLVFLKNINLQLYSNQIETRGASKIIKQLTKLMRLNQIVVNFNMNDKIKLEGVREMISSLRQMKQLTNLELNLIKVGVEKDDQINLKEDITKNKLGSPFDRVVIIF